MATEESDKRVAEAMAKFPIQKFEFERDTKKAMNACSFAIIGSSKSGKTTFLKHLLAKQFADDIKVLMTQSPQAEIYTALKKECAFAPAYIPDVIKTCYLVNKHTKNHYPFCIIVDDVVGVKNDRQMTKLMCLYRNSRMSAIVCGQDAKMLNPTGRANVNNICLFKQNTDNRIDDNIKDFLRTYFPKNLSADEKIELYKKLTADHCFLFVDNLNNTITRCKLLESQIVE
jgi:hypothetical protein